MPSLLIPCEYIRHYKNFAPRITGSQIHPVLPSGLPRPDIVGSRSRSSSRSRAASEAERKIKELRVKDTPKGAKRKAGKGNRCSGGTKKAEVAGVHY